MKLVGVILIIAGVIFGTALAGTATHSRAHVNEFIVAIGSLIAAAEIVVGLLLLFAVPPRSRGESSLRSAKPK
jgi:flagellar motor component MotA